MPGLTDASFNIEWMNRWLGTDETAPAFRASFDDEGQLNDPRITAGRAAAVIRAVDPDVLAIQEGPSRDGEPRLFAEEFLADAGAPRYEWFVGDGGQRKLGPLHKPGLVTATLPAPASLTPLTEPFPADVDCDAELADDQLTRTPLVVHLQAGVIPEPMLWLATAEAAARATATPAPDRRPGATPETPSICKNLQRMQVRPSRGMMCR